MLSLLIYLPLMVINNRLMPTAATKISSSIGKPIQIGRIPNVEH